MRSDRTPTLERPRRRSRRPPARPGHAGAHAGRRPERWASGSRPRPAAHAEPANCTTAGLIDHLHLRVRPGAGRSGRPGWTVPAGVDRATFTVIGGWRRQQPRAGRRPGRRRSSPRSATTPGQVLQLRVGGSGGRPTRRGRLRLERRRLERRRPPRPVCTRGVVAAPRTSGSRRTGWRTGFWWAAEAAAPAATACTGPASLATVGTAAASGWPVCRARTCRGRPHAGAPVAAEVALQPREGSAAEPQAAGARASAVRPRPRRIAGRGRLRRRPVRRELRELPGLRRRRRRWLVRRRWRRRRHHRRRRWWRRQRLRARGPQHRRPARRARG